MPQIAALVPRLQPEVLHAMIQTCGLEDCADIVAMATPAQLERVLDVDLWRADRPGADDRLDPDRFGTWLEVFMESGATVAARKLAGINPELVIAALVQHIRVFDRAARSLPASDEEHIPEPCKSGWLSCEIGGYAIEAKRRDVWDAIITLLPTLDSDHPDYFHRVMAGCRCLSDSGRELDGLDDLLGETEQDLFDLDVDRQQRREKEGYVTPAQARAFLQSARQVQLNSETPPPPNPLARAYFREIDRTPPANVDRNEQPCDSTTTPRAQLDEQTSPDAVAAIVEMISAASGMKRQPRGLLQGADGKMPRLERFHAYMEFAQETNLDIYAARSEEFAYLANAVFAGCSIQGRAFTAREAAEAATAVCNLGLENWPTSWLAEGAWHSATADSPSIAPDDFLVTHDLISVFQVGWTVLHSQVTMRTAQRLIQTLGDSQIDDPDIHAGLARLRFELTRQWRAGTPWRARDLFDVLLFLDQPAWVTLLGLISEYPVIHGGLAAARLRTHAVDASAFEMISDNRQIASIDEFMDALPDTLAG